MSEPGLGPTAATRTGLAALGAAVPAAAASGVLAFGAAVAPGAVCASAAPGGASAHREKQSEPSRSLSFLFSMRRLRRHSYPQTCGQAPAPAVRAVNNSTGPALAGPRS